MACKCFDTKKKLAGLTLTATMKICKCTCNARFQAEEKGMKFIIVNINDVSRIDKIKVDNYLITDNTKKKCDYLFVFDKKKFMFVELKRGRHIEEAIKQIKNTVLLFKEQDVLKNKIVQGFIVSSGSPSNNSTTRKQQVLSREKDLKITIRIRTLRYDPTQDKVV